MVVSQNNACTAIKNGSEQENLPNVTIDKVGRGDLEIIMTSQ
jgi:hypothetical protein